MLTLEQLMSPPTEMEVSDVISVGNPVSDIVRRLAFERDRLKAELAAMRVFLWAAANGQPSRELIVWDIDRDLYREKDCKMEFFEDLRNRRVVIRATVTP